MYRLSQRALAPLIAVVLGLVVVVLAIEAGREPGTPDGTGRPTADISGRPTADHSGLPTATSGALSTSPRPPVGPSPTLSAEPVSSGLVALGAFIPGAPGDPSKIDDYANLTGAMPHVVAWYQQWSGDSNAFEPSVADGVRARGAMPLISWAPWAGKEVDPAWTLEQTLNGAHDEYLQSWSRGVAAWGHPIYVILMSEMNGDWYPWSPGVNGSTASNFVASWRHTVDITRAEGATNVRWVWCPYVATEERFTPFASLYPGDDYVDWACLDGYNWGDSQSWSSWRSMDTIFKDSVAEIRAITARPLMIGETASSEFGGDKAGWITDGFSALIMDMPEVKAVVWFNTVKETDWRVQSSQESLDAFRAVAMSPEFAATLP